MAATVRGRVRWTSGAPRRVGLITGGQADPGEAAAARRPDAAHRRPRLRFPAPRQSAVGPRDARHQVVHVECCDPQDVSRFAELGVVACMQPRHCAPEIAGLGQVWAQNVGPDRWHKAWPLRSLQQSGATLAFSSDWNVAEMDPMVGLCTAVTRRPLGGGAA